MSIQVTLSMPEIYDKLCPKCKEAMEKLVKEKMDNSLVKQILQERGKE